MKAGILLGVKQKTKPAVGVWLAGFYLLAVLLLVIFLPVLPLPFSPAGLDLQNPLLPPAFLDSSGQTSHFLGTDHLGRDVLANLLYGFRTGLLIALPVMLVALIIGISLGSLAGFFGNRQFRVSRAGLIFLGILLAGILYYFLYLGPFFMALKALKAILLSAGYFLGLGLVLWLLKKLLKTVGFLQKKLPLPVDELVLKTMEVFSSVPRLVLILAFSALAAPGVGNVILLLSLTYWAGPARLIRAEVLKIKQLPYIEAAKVSGLSDLQILFRHILPNAAAPVWVAFSFGLSGLLGLEAALSFLGIGLPPEMPSWGRMLAGARLNPEAWWLIFFPALALCLTILAIQAIGNYFQRTGLKNG